LQEREIAVSAVEKACRIGEAVRAELVPTDTVVKADKSPVTVADFAIQSQVSLALRDAYPDALLVAEEEGEDLLGEDRANLRDVVVNHVRRMVPGAAPDDVLAVLSKGRHADGKAERFWTLDPVDGTKGFLRGGQYAIALALIENGEVVVGVLGCPNFPLTAPALRVGGSGVSFCRRQGAGTRMRNLKDGSECDVQVSQIADITRAAFCESVEAVHSSHDQAGKIAALLGVSVPPARMDSQCKYAAVAAATPLSTFVFPPGRTTSKRYGIMRRGISSLRRREERSVMSGGGRSTSREAAPSRPTAA
jgi:HAL2 family 3'(2'),5'-bisphosphate nucleotidase